MPNLLAFAEVRAGAVIRKAGFEADHGRPRLRRCVAAVREVHALLVGAPGIAAKAEQPG